MSKRFLSLYVLLLLFPLLMAAAPKGDPEPVERKPGLSKKSIAVISGTKTDVNLLAARFITQALANKSLLSVMSQEKVALLLARYPMDIRGPYTMAYFGITENYANTDMARIRELQRTLGVDYLYVIWAPTATRGHLGVGTLHFAAQLFEGPQCKEIDSGTFTSSTRGKTSWSCFSVTFNYPTPEKEAVKLKETCDETAGDIAAIIDTRSR